MEQSDLHLLPNARGAERATNWSSKGGDSELPLGAPSPSSVCSRALSCRCHGLQLNPSRRWPGPTPQFRQAKELLSAVHEEEKCRSRSMVGAGCRSDGKLAEGQASHRVAAAPAPGGDGAVCLRAPQPERWEARALSSTRYHGRMHVTACCYSIGPRRPSIHASKMKLTVRHA
jgi:hypothetical protein